MKRTYAIGDLHGRFDLLERAVAAIGARETGKEYTLVFLGDYIDRGPQSREIIERLMKGADDGARWICLKGNHEDLMLAALAGTRPMSQWRDNGGDQALKSYGFRTFGSADYSVIPEEHRRWIAGLPTSHLDAHRVYVHGWIDPAAELSQQDEHALMWRRYKTEDQGGYFERHVIHGHVPYAEGPLLRQKRTDLDTLAWKTGRLVVGVFDDGRAGGPIDLIEINGEPQRH